MISVDRVDFTVWKNIIGCLRFFWFEIFWFENLKVENNWFKVENNW